MNSSDRPLCDYEGSRYRTEFWEGQGRDYEDAAERIAMRKMLPASSERMVELGAGFGRLTDLYAPYKQVVLLDYSRSILEEAQQRLGGDPRFVFVVGNIYDLPFADGAFDTVAMIRVIHHLAEPLAGLREIRRITVGGGHLILEHANKRNLKAILRHLALRRGPSPFSLEPWEFVPLNFDFHPRHIENLLREVGSAHRAAALGLDPAPGSAQTALPGAGACGAGRPITVADRVAQAGAEHLSEDGGGCADRGDSCLALSLPGMSCCFAGGDGRRTDVPRLRAALVEAGRHL